MIIDQNTISIVTFFYNNLYSQTIEVSILETFYHPVNINLFLLFNSYKYNSNAFNKFQYSVSVKYNFSYKA